MAYMTKRGKSISVIYPYICPESGASKQMWETYPVEVDAVQRLAVVSLYHDKKDFKTLTKMAVEYKEKQRELNPKLVSIAKEQPSEAANLKKTFSEFYEKWAPIYCKKHQLEPNSIDSLKGNMRRHILPYFGGQIMSTITAMQVDEFIDHLNNKKCGGAKSYNKNPEDIPTLASATVVKVYNHLYSAFADAKEWGYMKSVPHTKTPTVKSQKRKYWKKVSVQEALAKISDKQVHLAVHMAFAGSFRPGELLGIEIGLIDWANSGVLIKQTIQRVSDENIEKMNPETIFRRFPKRKETAKSQLLLKTPKTTVRFVRMPHEVMLEIQERVTQIEKNKHFFGEEFNDYGLLFCQPNGDPIETTLMVSWFKKWQVEEALDADLVDMQGMRKSGQTYKSQISNDIMTIAALAGQGLDVYYDRYYEVQQESTAKLMDQFSEDFYGKKKPNGLNDQKMLDLIKKEAAANPQFLQQLEEIARQAQA